MIPENQAKFRKERGVIDNMCKLFGGKENCERRENSSGVFFLVDLKAVFDTVDRGNLKKRLEEERVNRRLRRRILKIYEKTKSVVRIKGRYGKRFWTIKGMR